MEPAIVTRRALLCASLASPLVLASGAALGQARRAMTGVLGLDAGGFGLRPGAEEDQTRALQAGLAEAGRRGVPLMVPPGRYRITGASLPEGASLVGVAGATHFVAARPGPLLSGRGLRRADIRGIAFDGRGLTGAQRSGLLALEQIAEVNVEDCVFADSGSVGLMLHRCGGRIVANRFRGPRDAALFSLDSTGLSILDNDVADCGNNGIQIWRTQPGDDRSIVRGNRVERIRSDAGGDGPNGNGISLFRAGGVIVEGNSLRDCALSFIRNNSGSGVQILGNQGRRCGEVALYSEFAFEGAIIAHNHVEDCAQGANITNLDHGGRLSVFANNIVRNCRRGVAPGGTQPVGGIGVHVEAEAAVTGNVIENASETGISLGWSWGMRNLVATGNVIRRTGIGVSVSLVPKARTALVANNLIAEAARGAVVGTEYGRAVTGDLTKAPDPRAAGVRVEGNVVG